MEKRLGRGLGSLLGTSSPEPEKKLARELPIEQIRANPFQPRQHFDADALEDLAQSIRQHGVLQPIVVRTTADGFELISGERRLRACKLAGRASIPAVVRESVSDKDMLELALVENVQRQDLDAIERALGFRRMQEELGMTQEAVAERVGLKRSTVTNHLRLLELSASVQQSVAKGMISMGHARALLALPGHAERERWLARIVRDDLSVRQVEQLTRVVPRASTAKSAAADELQPQAAWVSTLEARLRQRFGTKVELRNGPGFRGQVVLDFFGRQDLERLVELLVPKDELR